MADLFESALGLEENHLQEGFDAGVKDGRRAGLADGRALGLQKGFEMGQELGVYSGSIQIWRQLHAKQPGFISARAEKWVTGLEQQLAAFPLVDPRDERLQELMDSLRGRFTAVAAMLGLQDAYAADQKTEHAASFTF